MALTGCYREPPLHLYEEENPTIHFPFAEVKLDLYWNYKTNLGIDYDWRAEWYYGMDDENGPGWDETDLATFGVLEYVEPSSFNLRRYYKGSDSEGKRIERKDARFSGRDYRAEYDWGFWDLLAWNEVETLDPLDPAQSLHFEEKPDINEPITAYTKQSMHPVRYHAPRYQNAFYQPEQLFAACETGIDINRNLEGFVYYEEENKWIRELKMYLEPITYIYLPQIIIHHNYNPYTKKDRITGIPGSANLSGMARYTTLNTGIAGDDAVAVNFNMRLKQEKNYKDGEKVDIIGGRLMTFGICGQNANRITRAEENNDKEHHFLDVQVMFYNEMDSTLVFDVTDQVRSRYKGGVITVELDMDTVPIPKHPGGSGFDAVIKDYEEVTYPDIDLSKD